jgi:hypothetical protein
LGTNPGCSTLCLTLCRLNRLHTRDQKHGKKLGVAIDRLDNDLGNLACRGEDELRVIDLMGGSISHPDDKWAERRLAEEVANTFLHDGKLLIQLLIFKLPNRQ